MTAEIPISPAQSQESSEIPQPFRVAVLVSHESSGSNFKAIVKASEEGRIPIRISLALSDGLSAPSFEFAEEHHVPHEGLRGAGKRDTPQRDAFSRTLGERLSQTADIVVLAGFGLILTKSYLEALRGKPTLNIHPGVVPFAKDRPYITGDGKESPWNQGMMTEDAVAQFFKRGLKYAISTVHIITAEPDFGPVVERGVVEILPEDIPPEDVSPEEYMKYVKNFYDNKLKPKEHEALIRALTNPNRIIEMASKSFQQA